MVRTTKPAPAKKVILEPDVFRVLAGQRVETGRPIQSQVNEVLREHLRRRGLLAQCEPEPAAT